jgi:FKBP-type peptidyl-prolyl cis-trans isomerase 2
MENAGRQRITKAQAIIIALIIIGAVMIGYSAYGYFTASRAGNRLTVQTGDQVLVNYVGQFTNGLVFDTSMYSVAVNNVTFPKAPGFEWRGASQYTPLNVTSVGNGQLIPGFEDALIGMGVNQTKSVLIPPSLGYGPLNTSLLRYLPLYQNITMMHQESTAAFEKTFGVVPATGMTLQDPFWKWPVKVLSTGNGTTIYQYEPYAGETVYPYSDNSTLYAALGAWPVRVLYVNSDYGNGSGIIEVKNEITPSMVQTVGGINATGSQFTIWSLNSNGTVTLNFNRPVVGRTLVFTITVLFIYNPVTGKKAGNAHASVYIASTVSAVLSHVNEAERFFALFPNV